MIIVLKPEATPEQVAQLTDWLKCQGFTLHTSVGTLQTVVNLHGDTSKTDADSIASMEIVESVRRIQEPYVNANRRFHPEDTVIPIGDGCIGGGHFMLIAGPCSVENTQQICAVAHSVKASGAQLLRGGAYKPRTSPYAFQGLHEEGLQLLLGAKQETGLPVISEILEISHLPLFEDVDVIQVGARNMQNFELLKELGMIRKPILLKRGLANTLEELLMSAEYIMAGGNRQVILCERGIRTFENATRNTLDISAVPMLHRLSHLPVVVDPSHGTGRSELVHPMALAAVAAGADGLLIEVHDDPPHARCDGRQSLTPEQFRRLSRDIRAILPHRAR